MAKHTTTKDELYEMIQNKPTGDIAPDFCASGTIRGLEGSEMFFTVPDDADKVRFQIIPFINGHFTVDSFFGVITNRSLVKLENEQEWNHLMPYALVFGFEFKLVHKSPESHTITYVIRYTSNAATAEQNPKLTEVFCLFAAEYANKKPANKVKGVHSTNLDEIYEMIGNSSVSSDTTNLTSTGSLFKSGVPQPVSTDIMHFAVPQDATDIYFVVTEIKEQTLDTSYSPRNIHMKMTDFLALSSSGTSIIPDIKCYKVVNGEKWGRALGTLQLSSNNKYYIEVKANGHFSI